MAAQKDPRVTDLRRYRRERERAQRAASQRPDKPTNHEPILGGRPKAGLFLILVVVVLVGMWFLGGRH